jgi:succinate dehydrogenase / fumarate reductase membrane anchor subunit
MSLQTPLGKVLGHGPARGAAVHHWWAQRLSSLALLPLSLWLVCNLARLPLSDHAVVTEWIARGWNPLWLALTVVVAAWHSVLGVQVVIEDYVHSATVKTTSLLLSHFVHWLIAAAAVYAVLRIAFRGV